MRADGASRGRLSYFFGWISKLIIQLNYAD